MYMFLYQKDDILRRFKDKTRAEGEAILQGDQKVSAAEKEKERELIYLDLFSVI